MTTAEKPLTDPETRPSAGRTTTATDWWSFAAAVILSLTTLASAWSGYQAARWGGETMKANRAASVERVEGQRQAAVADRQLMVDVMVFTSWMEAQTAGDELLAASYRERFRGEFVPSFDSWFAQTVDDDLPAGTPFEGHGYELAASRVAGEHVARAEAYSAQADAASQRADNFVLTAVLYASVLFLAGIASKLRGARASHGAILLAGVVFAAACAVMVSLPFSVGF